MRVTKTIFQVFLAMDGGSYMTVRQLVETTGSSRPTVYGAINALLAAGLVEASASYPPSYRRPGGYNIAQIDAANAILACQSAFEAA